MCFMYTREFHSYSPMKMSLFPLLCLLCFVSIFFLLSLFPNTSVPSHSQSLYNFTFQHASYVDTCDYTEGNWIYDDSRSPAYDYTCKEIFKGWNCISSKKSNALELTKWRWKPKQCDLPQFDPIAFLREYRNTNMGFVGDSLNRNMFVSLFCTLKRVSSEVKKWRPAGADRGFTFLEYNLTIAYHRTNLLARYGSWSASANNGVLESLGLKEGYRVDVDIPESTWAEAPNFHDILILSTGQWWFAPSKFDPVKSPMIFFEKGQHVLPPILPNTGLDMVLKRMRLYVQERARPGTKLFLRTQSPRHFEGGDWDQGGSCQRQKPLTPVEVENLFALKINGTNMEARLVNEHLYKVLAGSSFHILDITHLTEFRADAHPASSGGKKHDDCMHWCLPGVTDTWNDLFIRQLNNLEMRS